MTADAQKHGKPLEATKYVFAPLLDATPTHPDTVLTTMTFNAECIKNRGQTYTYIHT